MGFVSASSSQPQGRALGLRRKKGHNHLTPNGAAEIFDLDRYRNSIPVIENDQVGNLRYPAARFESFSSPSTEELSAKTKPGWTVDISSLDSSNPQNGVDAHERSSGKDAHSFQSVWHTLLWPALALCVPMLVLSGVLSYIIFRYRIKPVENVIDTSSTRPEAQGAVLVDFSATKIVFLASFLSTLAPLLAGCIMSLMAVLIMRQLERWSNAEHFPQLPTPYQASLLIGILAASYEQLFSSLSYLLSHRRTVKTSPVLTYAVAVFLLTLLLGIGIAITDAYLHIATETINIVIYSKEMGNDLSLGKGLGSYCLDIDRLKDNYGFPCTWPTSTTLAAAPEYKNARSEMQRIAANSSTQSTVRLSHTNDDSRQSIAYLAPAINAIPENTNYMATTLGIGSSCSIMSPKMCNITRWGDNGVYTSFNCSSQFWGTLGLPTTQNPLLQGKAVSPYLSFLAINHDPNLIYNYFADQDLETVYNTIDLAANATWTEASKPWPDADLKNPIYIGYAWRSSTGSFTGGSSHGMIASGSVQTYDNASYVDYFLNCAISSYDVTYSYLNGSFQAFEMTKQTNGSILNMLTGATSYQPGVGGGDSDLQNYNLLSAIAGNTTASYETRYGELISQGVLSIIGAFSSERAVLKQQGQRMKLVAKVPAPALGALLGCALVYPIVGMVLLLKARMAADRSSSLSPLFSYWGLTSAVLLNQRQYSNTKPDTFAQELHGDQDEAVRLFIGTDSANRPRLGLLEKSNSGLVTELV